MREIKIHLRNFKESFLQQIASSFKGSPICCVDGVINQLTRDLIPDHLFELFTRKSSRTKHTLWFSDTKWQHY